MQGCSVQWNCYIPFTGFDLRATEIRKHDKVRETKKICERSIGPTQENTHKERMRFRSTAASFDFTLSNLA
jgi:hypothetical protein